MNIEKQIGTVRDTLTRKQALYGDAFTIAVEMLCALYPDGIKPEEIAMALLNFRIVEKMARKNNDEEADIAGMQLLYLDYLENHKPEHRTDVVEK